MPTEKGSILKRDVRAAGSLAKAFDRLRLVADCDAMFLSTTLPRGGLQIVQGWPRDPHRLRGYSRRLHAYDTTAWRALTQGEAVVDGHSDPAGRRLADQLFPAAGLSAYVAVPVDDLLLAGYPGVLHALRDVRRGPFTEHHVRQLTQAGEALAGFARQRLTRRVSKQPLDQHMPIRQFALCARGRMIFPGGERFTLDPILRRGLDGHLRDSLHIARPPAARLGANGRRRRAPAAARECNRVLVRDVYGDGWPFVISVAPAHPALTGDEATAVAFVSVPPECEVWSTLEPEDFAADTELARLIPAIRFLYENYGKGTPLTDVARQVHLSPFHFHRRFTELLGITPKRYLTDCQIAEAKRGLRIDGMPLLEVARRSGFAHQSHFTGRFKQVTGLTPTQWRRLARATRDALGTDD